MALAWNTRKLLSSEAEEATRAPTPVEFHFLTRRELYDNTILTADRYSSSAGEWVAMGEYPWYSVAVITRPVYALPQELCLSFGCYPRSVTIGSGTELGPPIDEVAIELGALLSLLVREPLIPLGARRIGGRPIRFEQVNRQVPRSPPASEIPACGVNSFELRAILAGLSKAKEADANAILAACRLYHAALSLSSYDTSTAYFSLVSAIECLAGHHFSEKEYIFDEVQKFNEVGKVIAKIVPSLRDSNLIDDLKREILRVEHFVWQKFRNFIEEFLPDEFWLQDELHPKGYIMPPVKNEFFVRSCERSTMLVRDSLTAVPLSQPMWKQALPIGCAQER